jgi:hypothetical protein
MISYLKSAFGPNFRRGTADFRARVAYTAQPAVATAQWIHGPNPTR